VNQEDSLVAGTVVLFNPGEEVYETISTYIRQVARLFVIDNSTQSNPSILRRLQQTESIVYINNGGNKGIANALNRGCAEALRGGYKYLLTMDQDTALPANFVRDLMKGFVENASEMIGIIAPRYTASNNAEKYEKVPLTMTSGNILNLSAYLKIGPFLNELFIDHVDHEFCLRLRQNGYAVVQANEVMIIHRPGHLVSFKFFGKKVAFSSHSPIRLYYFARNGFYVGSQYRKSFPEFSVLFRNLLLKEIIKIPFESNKFLRLKMIIKGYRDYRSEKLGAIGPMKT